MTFEPPSLVPPDDLSVDGSSSQITPVVGNCQLLAHNVAPDGKANPITFDDPYFHFVYAHEDAFYHVRGLNPEMMSGTRLEPSEARCLIEALPYKTA